MHEILTVQCGNTANYIGTHFWNFQDPTSAQQQDIDHDVLFSAGQARNGTPTYTPRLLIYDRARNFGAMARQNALFAEPSNPPEGVVHQEVCQADHVSQHPFQLSLEEDPVPRGDLLTSSVRYWSDYNMQFYRPQSYLPIDAFASTARYEDGHALFRDRDRALDGVFDTDVRPFLEECSLVRTFILTSSMHDAWSGWTEELVLALASECPKTPKLLVSTTAPAVPQEYAVYGNALLRVHDDLDACVAIDTQSDWHASAAAATWLDAMTLPMRSAAQSLSVADITSLLTPNHKLFAPVLNGKPLGPLNRVGRNGSASDALVERQFSVRRGQAGEVKLESRLGANGSLVTTYNHPSDVTYPASFPESQKVAHVTATLEDSSRNVANYIKTVRQAIGRIKGAKDYTDRRDMLDELVELEGRYKADLLESDESSDDDDGF